eukprot:SAG31_NODE_36885_length_309_cov_0.971429_1_plen_46_part_01
MLVSMCRASMANAFELAERCRVVFTPMLHMVQDNEGLVIEDVAQDA